MRFVRRNILVTLLFLALVSRQALCREVQQDSQRFEWTYAANFISQTLFGFKSPYSGPNSILSRNETEVTSYYSLSGKYHITSSLDAMVTVDMARGNGVGGNAVGLAGYVNFDVIRIPSLNKQPYFARYLLQWTHPLKDNGQFVASAGKLADTEIFDTNSYANSVGKQFINWALNNNAAYDFNADTQGFTRGIALQWVYPYWAFRIGSFQMPTFANGPTLASDLIRNRGDQAELEVHPRLLSDQHTPSIVRFLVYQNHAHMGNYADAINQTSLTNTAPNILNVEKTSAIKYGWGINLEQALEDDGATGFFARYGWNDGNTESFAYTESDRTASLGFQLSGNHWHIPLDRFAFGLVQNDLSTSHANYLALGGLGFQLGDGRLNYAPEKILETYYAHQVSKLFAISLDYQYIGNPGYNRDRGPVSVLSIRFHVEP